jgi:hypothetical protein
MIRRSVCAVAVCLCACLANADDGLTEVSKRPFLSVLAKDGNDWKVYRGRYLGKGETLAEPPVEGLYCAKVEVQNGVNADTFNGFCFGDEAKPLDVTKRRYLTVFVPDPANADKFRFARGIYLGRAEDMVLEAPAEGMVAVTILIRETGKKDKLETGWVYEPATKK